MPTISVKPKIIYKNGKPVEIVIKWDYFLRLRKRIEEIDELLEKIEDIYDLEYIEKTKKKKPVFKNIKQIIKENV